MTEIIALCMNPAIDVSTVVERVMPIHKLRCTVARRDPGGGGINVARVVHRLGSDVTAAYPAGGLTGQLLRRLVEGEGVRSLTVHAAGETREDFTVLEQATESQFRFVLPGPQLAEHEWQACRDLLTPFQGRLKFLVASGSLPPGVPLDFYGRMARMAKDLGAKFVLDSAGPSLREALKEGVYLIKPNLRELTELGDVPLESQDAQIEASMNLISKGGTEIVALTLGHQGALLVTRNRIWRAQPLPIKPISAVGAGDSFLGGMVWSLVSGHDLETAFRYGSAAGSAAVLAAGTELCRPDDVRRLVSGVDVQALAPIEPAAPGRKQ